jgi:hypothetical protein
MNPGQVEVADVSRGQCSLSAQAVAALHAALESAHADLVPTAPTVIDAVRRVCGEAKKEHWPPELLLIAFKKAVDTAPGVQHLRRGPERDEVVARLVSLCIEEYYRSYHRERAASSLQPQPRDPA